MKIKRLLLYMEILAFIIEKKSCSVLELVEQFEINEKTLYDNLESWAKEGYIKKEEIFNGKGVKYLKISSTRKLRSRKNKLQKMSQEQE